MVGYCNCTIGPTPHLPGKETTVGSEACSVIIHITVFSSTLSTRGSHCYLVCVFMFVVFNEHKHTDKIFVKKGRKKKLKSILTLPHYRRNDSRQE
jgi:hypothetical protein